jgi:EpsI family protein
LNPHSEIGEIHTMQGIAMLLVGLLILYGIDGVLEKFLPRRGPRAKRAAASSDARPAKTGLVGPLLVSALIAGTLATLFETLPRWQAPERGSLPLPDNQIPKELDGWTSTALNTDLAYLGIVRFRARVDREYTRGRESVRLFVGVGNFETRNGSPLSPKTAFPGSGWWREDALREVALPLDGTRARLSVVRFGTGNRRELVLDWTEGSRGLADEILRDALALDNSAWGRPREGVSVRISTPLGAKSPSRLAAAEALLLDFYRSFRAKIDLTGYPPSA